MSTAAADVTGHASLLALESTDIDVPNRQPPPGWTQVVYRLDNAPFRYASTRVDVGDGVDLEHAKFHGATRLLATLDDRAVHLLFPYGRDLRLRGVPVERRLVVLTPPRASFEGITQVEGCGHTIVLRGSAYEALCARVDVAARLTQWCRAQTVFAETPAAEDLRAEIEGYYALIARRPDLALTEPARACARVSLIDLMGAALESLGADDSLTQPPAKAGSRSLALAAERWIWDRVADADAPPVSLGASAAALGYSERRLQQAIEEHFGISFVRFVRAARLHQARAALRAHGRHDSVSAIATRYGFWHLGRFSRYYRETFGEAPSQTAAVRGAGEHASATAQGVALLRTDRSTALRRSRA